MRDFDQQLKAYGDRLNNIRCPYSDAELDREIRKAMWNAEPATPQASAHKRRHWLWPSVAAAACLAAVLIPLNLPTRAEGDIARIDIGGQHLYFACNRGCSAENTVNNLNTLIQ